MADTRCAYKGCDDETGEVGGLCHPHLLELQLRGRGYTKDEARSLAALDGTTVTTRSTELVEDVFGDPAGVVVTTDTPALFTVLPEAFPIRPRQAP